MSIFRVVAIEPDPLYARLLTEALQGSDVTLTGVVSTPEGAAACDADFVLVRATVVSSSGAALASLAQMTRAPFILYDAAANVDAVFEAASLPVRGFLAFNQLVAADFARAVETIAYGGAVIEPATARLLLERLQDGRTPSRVAEGGLLTAREEQVLAQVRRGLSNKEIARQMGLSVGTVRAHLRSIFRKLGVASRAGAVAASMA